VIPAQEYNERTDQDQFNTKVRALLQLGEPYQAGVSLTDARKAFDYTPLFMPRMKGDPVLEYRYQGNRIGVAFGFGEHGGVQIVERDCDVEKEKGKTTAWCDDDIPPGKSFTSSGPLNLGYVPAACGSRSVINPFRRKLQPVVHRGTTRAAGRRSRRPSRWTSGCTTRPPTMGSRCSGTW
jgi:hypothetical protein